MTTYSQALRTAKINAIRRKRRVISKRRIPSDKERIRAARRRGGFEDAWIDKKFKKNLEDTHRCWWCKKYMHPIFSEVQSKGKIIMTCDTPECPGNYAEKRSSWNRGTKKFYERHIDRKLMFDLNHLMATRDPSRMWATRKRTI